MWELQKAACFPQLKQDHQHTPAALEVEPLKLLPGLQ